MFDFRQMKCFFARETLWDERCDPEISIAQVDDLLASNEQKKESNNLFMNYASNVLEQGELALREYEGSIWREGGEVVLVN